MRLIQPVGYQVPLRKTAVELEKEHENDKRLIVRIDRCCRSTFVTKTKTCNIIKTIELTIHQHCWKRIEINHKHCHKWISLRILNIYAYSEESRMNSKYKSAHGSRTNSHWVKYLGGRTWTATILFHQSPFETNSNFRKKKLPAFFFSCNV